MVGSPRRVVETLPNKGLRPEKIPKRLIHFFYATVHIYMILYLQMAFELIIISLIQLMQTR